MSFFPCEILRIFFSSNLSIDKLSFSSSTVSLLILIPLFLIALLTSLFELSRFVVITKSIIFTPEKFDFF